MHEMSYMIKFINMAVEAASDQPDSVIRTVNVRVGAMTGVLPEYLYKYFPDAAAGTCCQDARLNVEFVPVEVKCKKCGAIYGPAKENNYSCPTCHSTDAEYLHGRELELVSIEL